MNDDEPEESPMGGSGAAAAGGGGSAGPAPAAPQDELVEEDVSLEQLSTQAQIVRAAYTGQIGGASDFFEFCSHWVQGGAAAGGAAGAAAIEEEAVEEDPLTALLNILPNRPPLIDPTYARNVRDYIFAIRIICWIYDGFGHDKVYSRARLREVVEIFYERINLSLFARSIINREFDKVEQKPDEDGNIKDNLSDHDAKVAIERLCTEMCAVLGIPFFTGGSPVANPIKDRRHIINKLQELTGTYVEEAGGRGAAAGGGGMEVVEAPGVVKHLAITLDSVTGGDLKAILRGLTGANAGRMGLVRSPAVFSDSASVSPLSFTIPSAEGVADNILRDYDFQPGDYYQASVRGAPFALNTLSQNLGMRSDAAIALQLTHVGAEVAVPANTSPLIQKVWPLLIHLRGNISDEQIYNDVIDQMLVAKEFQLPGGRRFTSIVCKSGTTKGMVVALVQFIENNLQGNVRAEKLPVGIVLAGGQAWIQENKNLWVHLGNGIFVGYYNIKPEKRGDESAWKKVCVIQYVSEGSIAEIQREDQHEKTRLIVYVAGLKTDGDDGIGRSVGERLGPRLLTATGEVIQPAGYVPLHVTIDEIAATVARAFSDGRVLHLNLSETRLLCGLELARGGLTDVQIRKYRDLLLAASIGMPTPPVELTPEKQAALATALAEAKEAEDEALKALQVTINRTRGSFAYPQVADLPGTLRTSGGSSTRIFLNEKGLSMKRGLVLQSLGLLREMCSELPAGSGLNPLLSQLIPGLGSVGSAELAAAGRMEDAEDGSSAAPQVDPKLVLILQLILANIYQDMIQSGDYNMKVNTLFSNPGRILTSLSRGTMEPLYSDVNSLLKGLTNYNNGEATNRLRFILGNPIRVIEELFSDREKSLARIEGALATLGKRTVLAKLNSLEPQMARKGTSSKNGSPKPVPLKPYAAEIARAKASGTIQNDVPTVPEEARVNALLELAAERIEFHLGNIERGVAYQEFRPSLALEGRLRGTSSRDDYEAFQIYMIFRLLKFGSVASNQITHSLMEAMKPQTLVTVGAASAAAPQGAAAAALSSPARARYGKPPLVPKLVAGMPVKTIEELSKRTLANLGKLYTGQSILHKAIRLIAADQLGIPLVRAGGGSAASVAGSERYSLAGSQASQRELSQEEKDHRRYERDQLRRFNDLKNKIQERAREGGEAVTDEEATMGAELIVSGRVTGMVPITQILNYIYDQRKRGSGASVATSAYSAASTGSSASTSGSTTFEKSKSIDDMDKETHYTAEEKEVNKKLYASGFEWPLEGTSNINDEVTLLGILDIMRVKLLANKREVLAAGGAASIAGAGLLTPKKQIRGAAEAPGTQQMLASQPDPTGDYNGVHTPSGTGLSSEGENGGGTAETPAKRETNRQRRLILNALGRKKIPSYTYLERQGGANEDLLEAVEASKEQVEDTREETRMIWEEYFDSIWGLKSYPIAGDGDCFFRALALEIGGNDSNENVKDIRNRIVLGGISLLETSTKSLPERATLAQAIINIHEGDAIDGTNMILIAELIPTIFRIQLRIFSQNPIIQGQEYIVIGQEYAANGTLNMFLHNDNDWHYDLLIPVGTPPGAQLAGSKSGSAAAGGGKGQGGGSRKLPVLKYRYKYPSQSKSKSRSRSKSKSPKTKTRKQENKIKKLRMKFFRKN